MPELNLRSIEPLVTILLVLVHPKYAQTKKEKTMPYRFESQSHGSDKAMRCAVCQGKFGLERRCVPGSASIALRRAAEVTNWVD